MYGFKCMLISHSENDVSFSKYMPLYLVMTFIKGFQLYVFHFAREDKLSKY